MRLVFLNNNCKKVSVYILENEHNHGIIKRYKDQLVESSNTSPYHFKVFRKWKNPFYAVKI